MQRAREEHSSMRQWLKEELNKRNKHGEFMERREPGVAGLWWMRGRVIGEQGRAGLGRDSSALS